jgi:hypothetical protein
MMRKISIRLDVKLIVESMQSSHAQLQSYIARSPEKTEKLHTQHSNCQTLVSCRLTFCESQESTRNAPTMRRSITRGLSLYRSALQRPVQPFFFTSRAITDRSFAADELTKAGVKLDKAADEPIIHVTQDMINTPNERVSKLVDEVLNLNLMEVGMFFQAIQVTSLLPLFHF